ncbi:thioredoxin-like protein [Schizophyllum commune]
MAQQITLYTSVICPFAHRAEIALEETGLPYKRYEIDLSNKPEWYPSVNPVGQVPAITYGGPDVPPDQPSPESTKLAESLVIIDFFNELAPNHPLLPSDPVLRAKARFFIESFSSRFFPQWFAAVLKGEGFDKLWDALEGLQALLPTSGAATTTTSSGKYAVGEEYTLADVAVAPFFARLEVALREDVGGFAEGEGPKAYKVLTEDARFARWREYFANLKERESFKQTWDEEKYKEKFAARISGARKA